MLQVTKQHVEQIAFIEQMCFGAYGWNKQMIASQLECTHGEMLAYTTSDNKIVGYMCLQTLDCVEVVNIAVLPDYRNKGIAMEMLIEAENIARQKQLTTIMLDVSVDNLSAQHLYEKFGLKVIATRKNFYEQGRYPSQNAYTMVKNI